MFAVLADYKHVLQTLIPTNLVWLTCMRPKICIRKILSNDLTLYGIAYPVLHLKIMCA